jgi:hypothetical protein
MINERRVECRRRENNEMKKRGKARRKKRGEKVKRKWKGKEDM